jgi:ABC-2 type transport system permease protein
MPLYDLSYRRFEGARTSRLRRSLALSLSAGSLLVKRRSFLLLLAACWVPAVVRAAQIYVSRQFPTAPEIFIITPDTFREFLSQQVRFLPVVLVSLATGASAIAADFASGAFTVYLSKPISRFDYLLGKAMPVAASVTAVTLVPALALLLLHQSLAPDFDLLAKAPWLPLSITAYSLLLALYYTLSVLAVSSLCRSGRVAGAGFARLPSLNGSAIDAGTWFFGAAAAPGSLVFLVAVMILAAIVLERRLSSGEGAL